MRYRKALLTTVFAVMAVITVTAVTAAPDTAASSDRPLQVWLLVDTSPSTKAISRELRTVADATLRALMPGDRLRILSAHSDRPRVRVIETIGPDRSRYPEIRQALEEIRPAAVLKADLAAALQVPLLALQENPASASSAVIFILTDGRMDDNQAERVLARVKEFEALGAHVICTGLDTSNRLLLVAAAQGRLRWTHLSECDPTKWITEVRQPSPPSAKPAPPPPDVTATPAAASPIVATPSASETATPPPSRPVSVKPTAAVTAPEVSVNHSDKETRPSTPAPMPPSDAEKSRQPLNTVLPQPITRDTIILWPLTVPERPVSPPWPPTAVPPSAPEPPTKPTMVAPSPPAPGPAPSFSPKKPIPAVPGNVASRQSTAPAPLPSGGQSSPKMSPVEPHRQSIATTAGRESSSGPTTPSPARPAAERPGSPAAAAAPTTSGTPGRSPDNGRHSLLYGALAVILSLAAFLAAVLVLRRRRSATAKQKTRADNQKKADRRELYAQVNGQEIALGPLAEVRRVDIGASSRATIPLFGDGLLPCHVLLRRDGEVFRLRNLAHKPIVANGVTVAPRGRARVVLPLDLALTDNVKVALQVRDQKGDEAHEITQKGAQDE